MPQDKFLLTSKVEITHFPQIIQKSAVSVSILFNRELFKQNKTSEMKAILLSDFLILLGTQFNFLQLFLFPFSEMDQKFSRLNCSEK